jgi:hypothetical protein
VNFKNIKVVFLAAGAMVFTLSSCSFGSVELKTDAETPEVTFSVTDSMQTSFYDGDGNTIDEPSSSEDYYGQDAMYTVNEPSFTDNGDGTVTDNITGLMWQQTPPSDKMSYDDAIDYVDDLITGGYVDWRMPTIQESFSLANLDGCLDAEDTSNAIPYIDTDYFDFYYDSVKAYTGSYWTSTTTVFMDDLYDEDDSESTVAEQNYGFNWADGHLKSYADGYYMDGSSSGESIPAGVRAVRGETGVFGENDYSLTDDGDTVTDSSTGLMWSQTDAEDGMNWNDALEYAESSELAGYDDWRLPTPKELQSIVEYGKTTIPAIDTDYFSFHQDDCYVWSSTTAGDFTEMADYVAFGHGWGLDLTDGSLSSTDDLTTDAFSDVHGPGCIRADYKYGTAPTLSQEFYEEIAGEDYPGAAWEDEDTVIAGHTSSDDYTEIDDDGDIDEFDLTNSENAADYICIYNRVMLVRDVD